MSKRDKLVERFCSLPKDFTFDELEHLLSSWGYSLDNKGTTSGSRISFVKGDERIMMHRPHPGNVVKQGCLKGLYKCFKIKGLI